MSVPPPAAAPAAPPAATAARSRALTPGETIAVVGTIAVGLVYTVVLAAVLGFGLQAFGGVFARAAGFDPSGEYGSGEYWPDESWSDEFWSEDGRWGDIGSGEGERLWGDESDAYYDYPGYADGDSGWILGAPAPDETIALADSNLELVRAALDATFPAALSWDDAADSDYAEAVNSYGGPSLVHDYTSAIRVAETDALTETSAKRAAVDGLTALLEPLGYDTVEVADEPDEWADLGYDTDTAQEFGDTAADANAFWVVTAYSSSGYEPTIELTIFDLASDSTGAVSEMLDHAREKGTLDEGVRIRSWAWDLLEPEDRDAFVERMDDFGGVTTDDGAPTTA